MKRKVMKKCYYRFNPSLLALSIACSGFTAVHAQTDESAISSGPLEEVEEVIVTARKRDENILDVPASISALTGDMADERQLITTADFIRQIPNAIVVSSGPKYLTDIALRGQGGGRLGFSESTTGIYRDGIYAGGGGFGGRTFSRIDYFDMQSMEVYRGPQGALYGRNAVGGAVNIRSFRPNDEFGGRVRANMATKERYEAEGVVNTPLGNNGMAARFGGYYYKQDDGFYENLDTNEILDTEDGLGGRASISVPVGAKGNALFLIEHSKSDAPGYSGLGQNLDLDPAPHERIGLNTADRTKIDQTSLFAEYTHEVDGMDLTMLANYRDRDGSRLGADFDHFLGLSSPSIDLYDNQKEKFERQGFEIRLASNNQSSTTWLLGADYQAYTSKVLAYRNGNLTGLAAYSAALRRLLLTNQSKERLNSYSLFGQMGFQLGEKWDASLEARVQTDNKDFDYDRIDDDPLTDESIPFTSFSSDSTRFLPTATLTYAVSDYSRAYGRITTGYRPGGFNPSPNPEFFDKTEYDPEDIISFELGYKGTFETGSSVLKTTAAIFYSKTDDVQATTSLSETDSSFALQNVGGNTVYGGELELSAYTPIGSGDLITSLGLGNSQGEWDDSAEVIFQGDVVDLSGLDVPRTRDYTANINVTYKFSINGLLGSARVGMQAANGGYDNAINTRESEDFETYDFSLSLIGEDWRVSAYGKNLTDEIYSLVTINNNVFYNERRRYGVRLTYEF